MPHSEELGREYTKKEARFWREIKHAQLNTPGGVHPYDVAKGMGINKQRMLQHLKTWDNDDLIRFHEGHVYLRGQVRGYRAMSRDAAIEWDTISEFEEQLDSIPGVTVNTVEALQTSNVAIDFSFEWPDRAPAEWPPLRYNAVENSAIILEQTIYVSEWQLRLAPIPQEGNPADSVEGKLKRRFERILDNQVTVRLASDGDVWTPHVHSMAMWSPEAEKVIADIGQMWSLYRDMVVGGEFGVV